MDTNIRYTNGGTTDRIHTGQRDTERERTEENRRIQGMGTIQLSVQDARKQEYANNKQLYNNDKQRLEEAIKEENQYAERVGTILAAQKKLFKIKQHLSGAKDPYLFLERSSGDVELYEKVKDKEFKVPNLPDGVEKTIILGRQWQTEIPYAGKTIRIYWCHEDYAFPHKWSKPTVYQGKYPEMIRNWLSDPKQLKEHPHGIPIILESANVNAEAMRDRERKVLIAWEKLKARTEAMNWAAWAKMALYIALGIAAIIFVWKYFGTPKAAETAKILADNASNVGGVIIN